MAVYDCFPFFNENDLLELRLNQHWDFFDKFIITEANETHTGFPKPFNFDQERFKSYKSKIIYNQICGFAKEIRQHPELLDEHSVSDRAFKLQVTDDWIRDHFQGNYPLKVLNELQASDDDIVYISALDEILNENGFNKGIEIFSDDKQLYYLRQGGISLKPPALSRPLFGFKLNMYAYKFNLFSQEVCGPAMTQVEVLKRCLPSSSRSLALDTHDPIENAGWHFTFLDKANGKQVLEKYRSWAHSRDTNPSSSRYFDIRNTGEAIQRMLDVYKPKKIDISKDTHPHYLIDNINKYEEYLL